MSLGIYCGERLSKIHDTCITSVYMFFLKAYLNNYSSDVWGTCTTILIPHLTFPTFFTSFIYHTLTLLTPFSPHSLTPLSLIFQPTLSSSSLFLSSHSQNYSRHTFRNKFRNTKKRQKQDIYLVQTDLIQEMSSQFKRMIKERFYYTLSVFKTISYNLELVVLTQKYIYLFNFICSLPDLVFECFMHSS